MPVDVAALRRFHASMVRVETDALQDRDPRAIAEGCDAALRGMAAYMDANRAEIEEGSYGSFARFFEVYAGMLERFHDVIVQSFALDGDDPGGVLGDAVTVVATALPFLDDPRAYAVRALADAPRFEAPGGVERRLLDLRATLADLERWKQREFAASWVSWGKLVWTMEHQAAWICTNLGDPVAYDEICFVPFDARLRRLKAAKAAKDAREAAAPAANAAAAQDEGGATR